MLTFRKKVTKSSLYTCHQINFALKHINLIIKLEFASLANAVSLTPCATLRGLFNLPIPLRFAFGIGVSQKRE